MTSPGGSNLANAGGVGVEVYPDTSQFGQKLGAQVLPDAKKLGAEIAKTISEGIAGQISKAIVDGIRNAGNAARGEATRIGQAIGADMGRAVRERMQAELRPVDIKVNADVTEAYVDIATLREEIDKLKDNLRIKADADTADAMAKLEALRLEAERLNGLNPTVRPGAGGGGGGGAGGVNQVDGAAKNATSSLGALATAGILLGPAIIPVAGAVSAAIAGIGTAALAAGAALASGVLGLSEIPAAVQALGQQQAGQAQNFADYKAKQQSAADATRQVAQAEQQLADARINAANAAHQADETLANAEESVSNAQISAQRAQQALTDARIAAKRQLEDYQQQLSHLGLDERQAQIALAKAQKELDVVLHAPLATDTQKQEAQLAVDEAQQRLSDLKLQGQRLGEDYAKAQQKGIDGSTQVVAAQDQIRSSTQALAHAQQALEDARAGEANTARTNAEQIKAAQQAVADAQRQQGQAIVATNQAATASTDALAQAMSKLSPAGREFASFIYGLLPRFHELQATAQEGFLPGLQRGIEALLPAFPKIDALIGDVSRTLGDLAARAGQALAGPYWQRFFDFVASQLSPALRTMGTIVGNVATGAAGLVQALLPLGQGFGQTVVKWTQDFALWTNKTGPDSGFGKLIAYIRDEAPKAGYVLGQIVTLAGRLVQAAAPIGGVTITILRDLLNVLNALPVPVLTALVVGVQAFVLVSRGIAIWSTIGPTVVNAIKGIWTALNGVSFVARASFQAAATAAQDAASAGSGAFGRMFAGIKGGAGVAGSAIGALAASFGPQAALTLAITAVTIGIGYLFDRAAKKAQESKQRVDDLTRAFLGLAQAQDQGSTAAADYVKQQIKTDDTFRDAILDAQKLGISHETIGGAVRGNTQDFQNLGTGLDAYIDKLQNAHDILYAGPDTVGVKDFTDAQELADQVQQKFGENLGKVLPKLKDESKALKDAAGKYQDIAKATGLSLSPQEQFTNAVGEFRDTMNAASPSADQLKSAIADIGTIAPTTTIVSQQLAEGLQGVAGAASVADLKAGAYALAADKVATSNISATEKASNFKDILGGLGNAAGTQGPTFDALGRTFADIANSELDASTKASLLKQAMQQMYGAAQDQQHAQENLVTTQDDLAKQLSTNSLGFDLNSKAAKGNSAEAIANRDAIVANRLALEQALSTVRDQYDANIAAGVSIDDARAAADLQTKAIFDQIPKNQQNTQAVKDLNTAFGEIPPTKTTTVSAPGLDQAIDSLLWARAIDFGLSQHPIWDRDLITQEFQYLKDAINGRGTGSGHNYDLGRADGGVIPGWSPHARADNIPAWLTAGEWVHPVAAVDYYGPGVMSALQTMKIPRELFGRFAGGGPVSGPWHVDVPVEFKVPDVAAEWDRWQRALKAEVPGGGTGDVERWRPTVLAVLNALGQPEGVADAVLRRINFESGGNPTIVNTTDSNWLAGHPSVGLAQVINSTYRRWVGDYDTGPYEYGVSTDGFANVYAGMRYALNRYGSIQAIDPLNRPYGYDSGGYLPPGVTTVVNGTGRPEPVFTGNQFDQLVAGRGGEHTTYAIYPQRADFTVQDLAALQARRDALHRVGRPR